MSEIKIALAGNPNSGKTTLFNALTGSNQYVGNWPGVTVEKKEGYLKDNKNVVIQDLPGIYSLSPYTLEEVVSRTYLITEKPDVIINIVDGTNIERNLYLSTQLMELGIPVVIAINMIDMVRKNGDQINIEQLSKALRCDVVEISALKGIGFDEVVSKAIEAAKTFEHKELPHVFNGGVEHALAHIEESIQELVSYDKLRWYAIKLFERDEKVIEELKLSKELLEHLEEHIVDCEKELDDDAESIITNQRYNYIGEIVSKSVVRKLGLHELSTSDKIDRIVTNRVLALPIFALVMFMVYYISVTTVGTFVTDWTNDVFVGEFLCGNLQVFLESINCAEWLTDLIVNGIVGGVGAVLGFVPQILILSLLLAILEDIGYMARVAFIVDRIFRKFGLSGKSFIPMLVASGCGVPGVMASRTIENDRDRKITIITTCFIPCGAKLPIIAMIAGALFNNSGFVAVSSYFLGVAAIIISGIILKKTKALASDPSPFVMELPKYHIPSATNVLRSTWERGSSFVMRAGTVILVSSVVLWFLNNLGFMAGSLGWVEDADVSLLAMLGNIIAPIFTPLGFGNWRAAVSTITGLIAKEEVIGTLGVLYGFAEVAEDGAELWMRFAQEFNVVSGYSFLAFNLLCAPCFAAMGAIKREMNNTKWTVFAIGYMCVFAYCVSLIINQIGSLILFGTFSIWTIIAFAVLIIIVYLVLRKNRYA
ncbi:MAG: ferrous iron transport protein B [Erysipelotrichales bacterium]|nr:ferrous iron transport protein B [Erysipelotrichales bacterium]